MPNDMDEISVKPLSGGINQSGVRNFNERLILSTLLRNGGMSGIEIARASGLSSQTASVILRKLEKDGLLARGEPKRGKVGKPSIPMELVADGALSFGIKIGRRSANLVALDLVGNIRGQLDLNYQYPTPDQIKSFLVEGQAKLLAKLPCIAQQRICGLGVAMPYEIWRWHDMIGAPEKDLLAWRDIDLKEELSTLTGLPTYIVNDATAACKAEQIYGRGKIFRDYAYFYIAAFIGGGIVLNHSVYEGNLGNAGALGSLRSTGPEGESRQLIDVASIHSLEARLIEAGKDPSLLYDTSNDWSDIEQFVTPWLGRTAQELAKATISTCAVIDFEAIIIDGSLPQYVKEELVERTKRYVANQDMRGLIMPKIEAGTIGINARPIGAACGPIFSQFFLDTNSPHRGS
jgi:predicted NBD/HSP70 family sugar kinase